MYAMRSSRGLRFGLARERFAGETLLDKDSFDLVRVTVKPYYDDRNGPPTARPPRPRQRCRIAAQHISTSVCSFLAFRHYLRCWA